MAEANVPLQAFNRGIISKLGLARVDVKRVGLSAQTQHNWMPRVLGSMMLRPGMAYIGETNGNKRAIQIPFVPDIDDTALLEMTDLEMRVRVNDVPVTRVAVSTTIPDGDFASFAAWTDASDGGCTALVSGGQLFITGDGTGYGRARQQITVAGGDVGKRHAVNISVARSTVGFRIGSTAGDDDYLAYTQLRLGTHSLAFTPAGDFWVEFSNNAAALKTVNDIHIEAAGDMKLTTIWPEAALGLIRWDESEDVIFVACKGYQQQRIERRAVDSWSVVEYYSGDGPFLAANISNVTITPSALTGNIVLTASDQIFREEQFGALFRLTSAGQEVSRSMTASSQFTDPIQVTGVGSARTFLVNISNTWDGLLTLQRSIDDGASWADVKTYDNTITTDGFSDDLDNQIVLYRVGFKAAAYISGTADVQMTISSGGITGIARITGFIDQTSVNAEVLKNLGGLDATLLWSEGCWSEYRGYPSAVSLYEGRLFWSGQGKIWGSVSDGYESYDDMVEGDAGPIQRTLGRGPVKTITWLLPLLRLLIGSAGSESSARSSSFDEPLTPTNFNTKSPDSQGAANIPALIMDSDGLFVSRGARRLYRLTPNASTFDYNPVNLSQFTPELLQAGVVRIAIQRQPDTRIHCVLADGTFAVLVLDELENVQAWITGSTDGLVLDVAVLPGVSAIEDQVYYTVERPTLGRFLEKWALETECVGSTLNKQADSFLIYNGAATNTLPCAHLEGKEVIVWADGKDYSPGYDDEQKTYTVTGGVVTLDDGVTVTNAVYGLAYTADYKSSKLAYAAQMGTALAQEKIISQVAVIASDMHKNGVRAGQDFDHLEPLPVQEEGAAVPDDYIWSEYDQQSFPIDGTWNTDSRLCLRAQAPRPATLLATVISMETEE